MRMDNEHTPSAAIRLWENLEIGICLVGMVSMMFITFIQVVARYGFNYSFSWSEEICRILMVWVTFGGSAYAFKVGAHIGVEALVQVLPEKLKIGVLYLTKLISLFFFSALLYYGYLFTSHQIALGHITPALGIPAAVAYSSVPIGSALVLLRLVFSEYQELMEKRRRGVHQQ